MSGTGPQVCAKQPLVASTTLYSCAAEFNSLLKANGGKPTLVRSALVSSSTRLTVALLSASAAEAGAVLETNSNAPTTSKRICISTGTIAHQGSRSQVQAHARIGSGHARANGWFRGSARRSGDALAPLGARSGRSRVGRVRLV